MSNSKDRLTKLDAIEQQLIMAIQSAGQGFSELSKDKPSMKNVESCTNQFLKNLENVENDISKQINYLTQVSTGQPHEGSSYASQKVLHLAWHRLEHTKQKLAELDRLKGTHQIQLQQYQSAVQTAQQQQHQQQPQIPQQSQPAQSQQSAPVQSQQQINLNQQIYPQQIQQISSQQPYL